VNGPQIHARLTTSAAAGAFGPSYLRRRGFYAIGDAARFVDPDDPAQVGNGDSTAVSRRIFKAFQSWPPGAFL